MNKEKFLRTLHLMMDKFETGRYESMNQLDEFYSFCESYRIVKDDANQKQSEVKDGNK